MALDNRSRRVSVLYALLFTLLAASALLSTGTAIARTFGHYGGVDFHANWYHAHSLRQGKNPYLAQVANDRPTPPIHYLDGTEETGEIGEETLAWLSTITAPLLLIVAPLAYLSWPTAKLVWMVIQLILAAWTPLLIIRLFPSRSFSTVLIVLLCLLFYSFRSTRALVINGQMSLPVIFLMLCALLTVERRWWLAGLLLGIALSKYSVALPVFLLLLYQGHFRVVAVSLAVQVAGLLAVSLPFGTSPIATLDAYVWILRTASGMTGIHAAALSAQPGFFVDFVIAALGSALVFGLIWHPAVRLHRTAYNGTANNDAPANDADIPDLHLLTVLILWTLLVAYHRLYDAALAFVFVVLIIYGLTRREVWQLPNRMRWVPAAALAMLFFTQMTVRIPLGGLLSEEQLRLWDMISSRGTTVGLILALGVSVWLYRRLWLLRHENLSGAALATP